MTLRRKVWFAILLLVLLLVKAETPAGEAPGDIVFTREGGTAAFPPAYFPHWIHRIRFKCYACHDAIFKMKRGANPISMDAMMEGKSCGTCHNGKVAWPITMDTCNRCHVSK